MHGAHQRGVYQVFGIVEVAEFREVGDCGRVTTANSGELGAVLDRNEGVLQRELNQLPLDLAGLGPEIGGLIVEDSLHHSGHLGGFVRVTGGHDSVGV